MTETLLLTKLYIPRPRSPNLVPRPHLVERLNLGLQQECKLILVSAPAGFGKTTLIADWIHKSQPAAPAPHFAWLSLDERDNDLTRFLTYLIAALQTVDSNIGHGLLAVLQSPEPVNVEGVLTALLNEVDKFPDAVILVLDDYHVIESPSVDEVVTFLLDHLPPQVHLAIAGRIDPSLPLSRLRARGQLAEIRAHNLRFTPEEAAVFLNKVMGLDLSARDIVALETRTEGWIAGLHLAALSLQGLEGDEEIAGFVNRFAGSDRYIQDYLADEVLQQRPQGTRDFLLQTSILDRLSAPLCDAVRFDETPSSSAGTAAMRFSETPSSSAGTAAMRFSETPSSSAGTANSQEILESLEANNLFILPLDNERRWFRYHHLFADLLVHRLDQAFPGRIPDLHRRASLWYENAGYIDDAVRHAQAAGDTELAADILETHWQEIIHRGEVTRLMGWLDALGPDVTANSAPLSMAYCWIHVFRGRNAFIRSHLNHVKKALKTSAQGSDSPRPMSLAVIPSLVETMEATIALEDKQAGRAKEHAQQAISLIPGSANPATRRLLQGAAAYRLAEAHRELGEYDQACAILLAGLEMLKASKNYFGAAATLLRIVGIYQKLGKMAEASILCQETLDYIEEHQWGNLLPSGMVHVMLADLQADAGDLVEAKRNMELGRAMVEQLESLQIRALAQSVDEKLRKGVSQPLIDPLSPRELEVLRLIARGYSNRDISEELFLALDTVKGHNRHIFEKLGVRNRTRAVNKAIALKLVDGR